MGGFFGVVSRNDCVADVFYGTDYHSHLGTRRGGLTFAGPDGFSRVIHDITISQFRAKFEDDIGQMRGSQGIGVISDTEDQPLIISSHLGTYAIVTVGAIKNAAELVKTTFRKKNTHFSEMSGGGINPTELVATLINQGDTFEEGIRAAQAAIEGSCSMLLLTGGGLYAARDKLGRTPVILGRKDGSWAVTMETCAFPNLGFEVERFLGPGEIIRITPDGVEQLNPPGKAMRICAFLWVYYGYPASSYENVNVEDVRYRCGACLAARDKIKVDCVAGIPDSGTGHALGYAQKAGVPYQRPFVKYTPTWPRSFMPQDQSHRDLVAQMKLIPIRTLIDGKRILFCEDSIVRGTQLKGQIRKLFDYGAREIHMRPACPPLKYSCKYLNFSRSKSEFDLAARRAISKIEGRNDADPDKYVKAGTEAYEAMVEAIRDDLGLTTLKYQVLDDLLKAIGIPVDKICTYCWSGEE